MNSVALAGCLDILNSSLDSEVMQRDIHEFIEKAGFPDKWLIFSDYCLHDKNKPNDVITFVMMPFYSRDEFQSWKEKIAQTQPKDIKHSRAISEEFMAFLKSVPMFSFSFIVNDREMLFGKDDSERNEAIRYILNEVKSNYQSWIENATEESTKDYYKDSLKNTENQLKLLFQGKNKKNLIDILLISILGGFYSAKILKDLPSLENVGWLPDRDVINEACEGIAGNIFFMRLYNMLGGRQFKFILYKSDSKEKPFYDDYNRIADIICGSLADYYQDGNLVSKDKFSSVLQGLIADNKVIKVYRLFVNDEGKSHVGEWEISNSPIQ